ncbi:hypothetical protein WA158_006247 [Blastocystis sp. Blastoise]
MQLLPKFISLSFIKHYRFKSDIVGFKYDELVHIINGKTVGERKIRFNDTFSTYFNKSPQSLLGILPILCRQYFPVNNNMPIGFSESLLYEMLSDKTGKSKEFFLAKKKQLGSTPTIVATSLCEHTGAKIPSDISILDDSTTTSDITCEEILNMLRSISKQQGKGSTMRALQIVSDTFSRCNSYSQYYVLASLICQSSIRFEEKTVINCLSSFLIENYASKYYNNHLKQCDQNNIYDEQSKIEKKECMQLFLKDIKRVDTLSTKYNSLKKTLSSIDTYNKVTLFTPCNLQLASPLVLKNDNNHNYSSNNIYINILQNIVTLIRNEVTSLLSSTNDPYDNIEENRGNRNAINKDNDNNKDNNTMMNSESLVLPFSLSSTLSKVKDIYQSDPNYLNLCSYLGRINNNKQSTESMYLEMKYDGFRVQIHKENNKYAVYGRSGNYIPSLTSLLKPYLTQCEDPQCTSYIIDGEFVCFDNNHGDIMSFQNIGKYSITKDIILPDNVSPRLYVFDVLDYNHTPLLSTPFSSRRTTLTSLFSTAIDNSYIQLAYNKYFKVNESPETIMNTILNGFEYSLNNRGEGLIFKLGSSSYSCGQRNYDWLKMKKDYLTGVEDTLDLVVLGYSYGKGKRTQCPGSFLMGIHNPKTNKYQPICNVGTGFTDNDLNKFNKLFNNKTITRDEATMYSEIPRTVSTDVYVNPEIIFEIKAADIQLSSQYNASNRFLKQNLGLTLRFPRFIKERTKQISEITSDEILFQMYQNVSIAPWNEKITKNSIKKTFDPDNDEYIF